MEDDAAERRNESMPAERMGLLSPQAIDAIVRMLSSNLDAEYAIWCAQYGL